MFANNQIKLKGKDMTGITLVTGFLSKSDEICNGFCWCEENKKMKKSVYHAFKWVHFKMFCLWGIPWQSRVSLIAQLVRIHLQCRRPQFDSWVRKIHWRRDRLPSPVFLGFPCGSAGTESARNAGDLGSIPGLERFPGEGKGYRLQYSGLENSIDCVHGVSKSWTQLKDFHLLSLWKSSG